MSVYLLRIFDPREEAQSFVYSTKVSVVMEHIAWVLGEADCKGGIFETREEAKEQGGLNAGGPFERFALWENHDPTTRDATDAEAYQLRDLVTVIEYFEDPEAPADEQHRVVLLMNVSRVEPIPEIL